MNLENYWWTDDNLTAICDSGCAEAVGSWNYNASDPCYEQTFTAYGKLVPIWTVTERVVDNLIFACLESRSENYTYCLTESQEWVGADVLRVDCDANPSDPTCGGNSTDIPEANVRLANLYEDDILCSDCFINQLYTRLTSIFLPDTDYSDYLADQIFDIQDVCNITIPDFTIRLPWDYDAAEPLSSVDVGSSTTAVATATTSTAAATTTCVGQTIGSAAASKRAEDLSWFERSTPGLKARQASSCGDLSSQYGVSTGALQWFTNSDTCAVSGYVCLPQRCTLQKVGSNETCESIAASIGGGTTIVQFKKWNTYVLGLCDSLSEGQYDTLDSSPGVNATYTLPAPPLGTAANAGNQQRGGAGGIVTPTTTATDIVNPVSGGAAPSPTQDGLVTNCNNYASATAGDGCEGFATRNSIEPTQLYAWNPVLGTAGSECSTALWASEYYCIGTWKPTQTSAVAAPGPTQTGITSSCNKFAEAISGDVCTVFASRNNITPAQLYAWNTVLGANGENCAGSMWAEEYYCVGVVGSSSSAAATTTQATTATAAVSTTATQVTAPGPTQTGIVSSCSKFAKAPTGVVCGDFASSNSISTDQLYAWNTVLGANGANCASSMWANEYYCVGITVAAPGPTQAGIDSNCARYAEAPSGATCTTFSSSAGITLAQLYAWNPILGANGENCASSMWALEYYCISVTK
ncbi:LysM domain-containing protein [Colletotrichum orchidophilum]|uniref:LysM domain-containing protein n=1 Tax=Colletotrichum orchidophilum TaxID=1209926 RepID=A0A1G4B864_9PEZI|nr:LysM domain-containing protein [Colletotrichum orchidophilum]OHE97574.1 LysM domain-containing protein [Colletotrichum orchidophilum]